MTADSEFNHDNTEQQRLLERNVRLYPWYQASAGALPWLPVFFLYFLQYVSLERVIVLSAIYYMAVVFCEVPSGFFSDRFGRRVTLLMSSSFLLISYVLFISAPGFAILVIAQVFLAAGIAFQSGSDTALHYDTLQQLGWESRYTELEAKATQYNLAASAACCVIGGGAGVIDLSYPYYLGLLAAATTIYLCSRFVEPASSGNRSSLSFVQQLLVCAKYASQPVLFWLLCFYVVAYCLQHVTYEFYQPYIQLLDTAAHRDYSGSLQAPLLSGIVLGASMLIGVFGAKLSMPWLHKLGLTKLLLAAVGFQTVVLGMLGMILHPLILALVITRNFSMAMTRGPLLGAIGPRVNSAQRATYLSMRSLLARLAFSVSLYLLSLLVARDVQMSWPALSLLLQVSCMVGLILLFLLGLSARWVKDIDK